MKKIIFYAMAVLMLSACGNKTKNSEELLDSLMMAGDSVIADAEVLPPMFLMGKDSKYNLMLYWTETKEPKKTKDNAGFYDEYYQSWALQEIFRRNAEQYTNLLVGEKVIKVKYIDEVLKDPDGNTPSIGQIHGRNDIPSLSARFDVVDAKDRKKADEGMVIVTDDYLDSRKQLHVKTQSQSNKKLPAAIVKKLEKKYGMDVSRSVLVATIGDKYMWGAVQFDGEYEKASKGKGPDDPKASLALNVLTDGTDVWSTEEIGYYLLNGEMGWNVDDGGEYIPCNIVAAFEGPKGLELCYTHYAPESAEMGMFYQRDKEMVQKTYSIYQCMIDEQKPIWKKDFALMDKMYHADENGDKYVKLTKWAFCYIDYENTWIWLRDKEDKHGAFFLYKDGKYKLMAIENPSLQPTIASKDGVNYLILGGPAGGPAWNIEVHAFKDAKRIWKLNIVEIYGEIDECWLNGKSISVEEGRSYFEKVPSGKEMEVNFRDISEGGE